MPAWPTDPRLVNAVSELLGEPGVRGTVAEVITALNLYPKAQTTLLQYCECNPDALVSGRSDGPASRLHLLNALADSYPELVVPAKCSDCGRQVRLNRWGSDGSRICTTCYAVKSTLSVARV